MAHAGPETKVKRSARRCAAQGTSGAGCGCESGMARRVGRRRRERKRRGRKTVAGGGIEGDMEGWC